MSKRTKVLRLILGIMLVVSMLTVGCKAGDKSPVVTSSEPLSEESKSIDSSVDNSGTDKKAWEIASEKFPNTVTNEGTSIEGGTLKFGLVMDGGFKGLLSFVLYEDSYDSEVLQFMDSSLLDCDANMMWSQTGASTFEYDVEEKTFTIKIKDNVNWHDGEPVTADDLVYAYEIISRADYKGIRYTSHIQSVEGVEEYHAGTADSISGLEIIDEKTLKMHFKEFYPALLQGGSLFLNAAPRHYWGDLSYDELVKSPMLRETPIGFGAFKLKSIVPGEAVEFVRNDDYYKGAPKLDGVSLRVVSTDLAATAMANGEFDLISTFDPSKYADHEKPTNFQYAGRVYNAFDYIAFKLGTYDAEKGANLNDPTKLMADINLRQAIAYAIDPGPLGEKVYNGLKFPASTIINPAYSSFHNRDMEGFTYNPEKAKQILEDAGYIDLDGDGMRENTDGEPMEITFAVRTNAGADDRAQYYIQAWEDVGLKVSMYTGRTLEINAFYEEIGEDNPKIDMYEGGWYTGFNPSPSGLWGSTSQANYTRYSDDTLNEIMSNIDSEKAWDSSYAVKEYTRFQEEFFKAVPAIPTLWEINMIPVNNRVMNYTLSYDYAQATSQNWQEVELLADEPMR